MVYGVGPSLCLSNLDYTVYAGIAEGGTRGEAVSVSMQVRMQRLVELRAGLTDDEMFAVHDYLSGFSSYCMLL